MRNKIGEKIRLIREQKGLSQDNLASELGITQPSYARLEKDDARINVPRLIQIAFVLNTTVSELIDEKAKTIINQQYSKNSFGYVEVFNSEKEHIQTLKAEVDYLKQMIDKLMK